MGRSRLVIVAVALLTVAASPGDWVRRGNAAFERGDFEGAVRCYEQAEALASDPGLVAFNLAAAHYELQRFAEAEQGYRRALEDADGPRRVRALYGLGNALTRQGHQLRGRAAVVKLLTAKKAYDSCLAAETAEDPNTRSACHDTFADARFNLRLVEQLLEQKRTEAATEPPPSEGGPDPRPPDPRNGDRGSPTREPGKEHTKQGPSNSKEPAKPGVGPEKPTGSDPPPAGNGNLPMLLDDRDAPPLDSARAQEHLEAALDRIRRESSQRSATPPGAGANVKDW